MESFTAIAQDYYPISLVIGIGMLIIGGNLLVEGGVAIAKKLGVSVLVIGLTIVAFSTSSPELALNVIASWNDHGELCFGNIIGSNIANIGLVLGIGALICKLPVTGQIIDWEFPWLAFVSVFVGVIALIVHFNLIPIAPHGLSWPWAILLLVLFCVSSWKWFKLGKGESEVAKQSGTFVSKTEYSSIAAGAQLFGGLILLALGGKATELGAVSLATNIGISEIVIGGTIVAIATSLPEVVTTIIAAKKGHPDLAVGNVVGSNLFNVLFVLPITMLIRPVAIPSGPDPWVYIVFMIAITILAWRMTLDTRVKAKEGRILVSLYVCFLVGITIWKSVG
ncbi:MAG: sodium:calcium antiporter [Phycisphaerales bacterium]|jgi:cation:H+ antiporter|nr:sodium:calcium antiporter [Phycisphaerales bacterium]MDP6692877.1 sodium:calcium antiporter [Phycisphaerales bacterium]